MCGFCVIIFHYADMGKFQEYQLALKGDSGSGTCREKQFLRARTFCLNNVKIIDGLLGKMAWMRAAFTCRHGLRYGKEMR